MEYQKFSLCPDKLAEAALYLAERSANDPNFGETKLVKMLYFADCAAYARHGAPITGATYVHMEHGPYPQDWRSTKERLIAGGEVREITRDIPGGYRQCQLAANRQARTETLTAAERACLDIQLREFASFNAAAIEEYSHRILGWRETKTGETIPYELSMFHWPTLTDDARERGRRIVAEYTEWLRSVHAD